MKPDDEYPCYICEQSVPSWQEHVLPVGKSNGDVIKVCPLCYTKFYGFTSGD